MRSATHMIPRHRNMRCNNMTTSQHNGPLTTLHGKCQHANSNHLTTACYKKKLYDKSICTSERNNLYIMTSSICNTWRQTFFSHDSTRPILGMGRRAFPALSKTHYPRWWTNIGTYRQQTKQKYLTRNHPWEVDRSKHRWCTANNRHAKTRVEIYDALRITHRLTPHKVANINTKLYLWWWGF
jgi:hypothetical protein